MIKTDELLNYEKKQLLKRVTRHIGKLIDQADVLGVEYEKYLGIPGSRISEWKNYDKYQTTISIKHLGIVIENGVVSIDDLIKVCAENDKEIKFLKECHEKNN